MIVVSNTTPIISLASVGKIEILKQIFDEICIPESVYNELRAKESYGFKEVEYDFIQVKKIKGIIYKDLLLKRLDEGESETIVLAKELEADLVIIDDNIAYKIAKNIGLNVIRTLSILLVAKERRILTELKPVLDEMIAKGRWFSTRVYQRILEQAGEL